MKRNRLYVAALAILSVLVFFTYLWGFWPGFILLSLVYFAIAIGIIFVMAVYNGREERDEVECFTRYVKNNNTWFFVLLGATVITLVIACFNFGPAILLPKHLPTPEQRGALGDFFNHLLHGKNAAPRKDPTGPLPWATGTWFWWKGFILFFVITLIYAPFAFWDEAKAAYDKVEANRDKRRLHEEELARHQAAKPAGAQAQTPATGQNFTVGRLLFVELFVEFVTGLVRKLIKGSREAPIT